MCREQVGLKNKRRTGEKTGDKKNYGKKVTDRIKKLEKKPKASARAQKKIPSREKKWVKITVSRKPNGSFFTVVGRFFLLAT